MLEAKRIATQLDKIYDSDMTNRLVKSLSSASYTLTKIEQLAWQYADGSDASSNPWSSDAIRYRLYLGAFIAWLQQREREGGGNGS